MKEIEPLDESLEVFLKKREEYDKLIEKCKTIDDIVHYGDILLNYIGDYNKELKNRYRIKIIDLMLSNESPLQEK